MTVVSVEVSCMLVMLLMSEVGGLVGSRLVVSVVVRGGEGLVQIKSFADCSGVEGLGSKGCWLGLEYSFGVSDCIWSLLLSIRDRGPKACAMGFSVVPVGSLFVSMCGHRSVLFL